MSGRRRTGKRENNNESVQVCTARFRLSLVFFRSPGFEHIRRRLGLGLADSNPQGPSDMNAITQPSKTRSFSTVFLIELWERFGFYDVRANLVWSAGSALIYVAPAIGGWVGDGILGTRRTMLTGAAILAIGYGLITLPTENPTFLYFSLGVIVVGNGLFKPNAGNLVRKIYEGDDSRIDSAFTIYYMAVNIGSTISMLLTPWIKDAVNSSYGHEYGWHAAFGACCVGLALGLTNYTFMRKAMSHIGSDPDEKPVNMRHYL